MLRINHHQKTFLHIPMCLCFDKVSELPVGQVLRLPGTKENVRIIKNNGNISSTTHRMGSPNKAYLNLNYN